MKWSDDDLDLALRDLRDEEIPAGGAGAGDGAGVAAAFDPVVAVGLGAGSRLGRCLCWRRRRVRWSLCRWWRGLRGAGFGGSGGGCEEAGGCESGGEGGRYSSGGCPGAGE